MALVLGVNSFATVEEADCYFEDRIDVANWDAANYNLKSKAIVTASRYLDGLSYAGYATTDGQDLAFPRMGCFYSASRGRDMQFNHNYVWTELPCNQFGKTSSTSTLTFERALKALPLEIELIKKATFEQAYHLINNDTVLDTNVTTGTPESIRIGSIAIEGLRGDLTEQVPIRSRLVIDFIRPLLVNGGANLWFKAN